MKTVARLTLIVAYFSIESYSAIFSKETIMPTPVASDPTKTRNVSVRLPESLFQDVADVARLYHLSMGQVIRDAIQGYVASCRTDPAWSDSIAEMEATLERLRVPPLPAPAQPEPDNA